MVKVFAFNKNGKLEFTKEELEKILNEAWNDGYAAANRIPYTYTYTTPDATANPNWWDSIKYTYNWLDSIKYTCNNTEENK